MKRSKKSTRILGLLATITVAITFVSMVTFLKNKVAVEAEQPKKESSEVLIVEEDISKREENVKHFLNENGSYTAVMYDGPVHYKKGNAWAEIDNSLISSDGHLENRDNPFKVQLPTEIDSNSPVMVSYGDYKLSFCFEGIVSSSADVKQGTSETVLTQELQNKLSDITDQQTRIKIQNEYKTSLTKNYSALSYDSVKSDIDLNYYISGTKLKEDIVFYSLPEAETFTFNYTYTGLKAVLQKDNSVAFLDEGGETIFIIDSPYMFDANDENSADITVTLEETENGCRYTLTPDREWLQNPERVWPVTLDPTTSQNSAYTHDNGVNQSDPTTVYKTNNRMYLGTYRNGSASQGSWIFLKYTNEAWPTIPATGIITNATMKLNYYPTGSWQTANNVTVDVHLVTKSWSTDTITWNNKPSIGSTYISSYNTGNRVGVTSGSDTFDVTTWVKNHYANSSADQGIALKPRTLDGLKTNRACLISSDYATAASRPLTNITYVNAPDLQVSAVTVPAASTNKTININASVKNAGGSTAAANTVSFTIKNNSNTVVATLTASCPSSAAGATATTGSVSWTPTAAGTYTITAKADSANVVTESNEANNEKAVSFTVTASPDLTANTLTVSNNRINSPMTFSAKVNNANAATGVTSTTQFQVKNSSGTVVFTSNITCPVLTSGGSVTLTSESWTPTESGSYTLTVIVDSTNVIIEHNEGNNTATLNVQVLGGGYSEFNWSYPLKPVSGANINILAPYSNQNLGIDIGCDYGSSVFSVDNGLVLESGYKDKLGNYIIIKTDSVDPITGKKLIVRYTHLQSISVAVNARVDKGTTEIGRSGATGLTTVPKLHIDINNAEVTADNQLSESNTIDPKKFWTILE